MNANEDKIWFPAKKYGYGWGPPNCWQGWAVLAAYILLDLGGVLLLPPSSHMGLFMTYVATITIALFVILRQKGEKPKWRWGRD